MKRINFYLPEEQIKQLSEIHRETGAPVSELVRRAIASYVGAWCERREKEECQKGVEVQD